MGSSGIAFVRVCVLFVCFVSGVLAQDSRGSILGRVADPAGGLVPGATVRIVNLGTNAPLVFNTNAEGNFTAPYLIPGQYKITVEAAGFKSAVREPVELRTSERRTVDFTLEIGSTTDSVVVKAEEPLLDVVTATQGTTIDGQRLADLPMVGGNPYYLSRIAPGFAPSGGRTAGNAFDYGAGQDSVNGTRGGSNEVSLDGSPNMFGRSTAFSLPEDLVQEMRIETAPYDAASGRASGATVNVNMKAGTNAIHGTAYLFDSRLRAVPWFTNQFIYNPATGPVTPEKIARNTPSWLHQRWGATASGPLRIPKVYDGRNRTFWSFGYEGLHILRNLSFVGTMPTAEQRTGNLSALLRAGANYQVYDPSTIAVAPAGRFSRQPFPGNIIPASRISPISRAILPFYPDPNQPGSADFRSNYFNTQVIDRNNLSVVGRLDHNFSERHRLFVRINHNYRREDTKAFPSEAIGDKPSQPGYGIVLDDVYTFSPSFLMNVRYGLTYQRPIVERQTTGFDLSKIGFSPGLIQELGRLNPASSLTFPAINIDGGNYTQIGHDAGSITSNNYHNLGVTMTRLSGNHNLRFGVDLRLFREGAYAFGNASPRLDFAGAFTNGPLDNNPGPPVGAGLAAFLLGQPTGGIASVNASRAEQSTYSALFLQDDWKLTKRLTLNLGLRYEYEGPITERFNRSVRSFDFASPNPVEAEARINYAANPIPEIAAANFRVPGGLLFAGNGNQPRGLWRPDRNNFAPRLGMAYQLNGKTVLRTGYGIFFDVNGSDRNNPNQAGYSQATNLVPTLDNGQTFVATLANPFPGGIQQAPGASQGLATFLGRAGDFFSENRPNPYMQRWSFSVQRQLPSRMVAEIGYIGNRGTKLAATRAYSPIPREFLSTAPTRDLAAINRLTANVRNPFQGIGAFQGTGLFGVNVQRQQLLRAFPQFTQVNVAEPAGYSYYHSLQAQVEKRFSKGLSLQASFTHSRFMEATGYLEPTDSRLEKVVSDLDFPNRLVISGVYQLPVGRGRQFGSRMNGWLDAAIGGWQVESLWELQEGQPLGFGNAIFTGDVRNLALPRSERTPNRWFNTGAGFERNNANRLDQNIRTLATRFSGVRAPGTNNVDASIAKNFRFRERYTVQFRMEGYNALNKVQFGDPVTDPFNTNFGQILGERGHGQRQVTFGFKFIF